MSSASSRFKVSTKACLGPDSDERRDARRAVHGVPHCEECLTTNVHGQWIYVECDGIMRFCSWECLFVWSAGLMAYDDSNDPRVKVKRL